MNRSWSLRGTGPFALRILLVVLALGMTAPVRADVGPPITVDFTPTDPDALPAPGDVLRGTLQLTSGVEVGVQSMNVESGRTPLGDPDWAIQLLDAPVEFVLYENTPRSFAVELIANDPSQPFDVVFQAGTHTVKRRYYVQIPYTRAAQSLPSSISVNGVPTEDQSPASGGDPAIDLWAQPAPFDVGANTLVANQDDLFDLDPKAHPDADTGMLAKSLLLQVKGRLLYDREGEETLPVDGATVLVYDYDQGEEDDFLGSGVTKADGTFDFPVFRGDEAGPDVYLVFCSANQMINVQFTWFLGDVDDLSQAFTIETGLHMDTTANMIDFGDQSPNGGGFLDGNVPFHILSTLTKAWRYVGGLGYNSQLDRLRVAWPSPSSNAFYEPSSETIYVNPDKQWKEDTIIHEFGHHWQRHYTAHPDAEYCNSGGYGDSGNNCGHRRWCEENAEAAWVEGSANFIADLATVWISDHYYPVGYDRNEELIGECGEDGQYGSPYITEGILGALMRDLADFSNENDPAFGSVGIDKIGDGVAPILAVAATGLTSTPASFLNTYRALHPGLGNALWSTAMNCGYDLDTDPPGLPTNLASSSHPIYGSSPDGTVDLSWDAPTDDISGVRRYIVLAANTPSYPSGPASFYTTYTNCTTPELGPGTWWITVLAEDWSGKQGVNYATYGPITIQAPEPPDFAMEAGNFWPYAVVPRKTADSTSQSVPLPNFLPGDQPQTYFNYRLRNLGGLPNPVSVANRLWVDGLERHSTFISSRSPLPAGATREYFDKGPYTVRGGRHMLTVRTDADELMPEGDEANNRVAQQFIWAPTILVQDAVDRTAPPDPWGGFSAHTIFSSPNCDGLAYLALNTSAFTGIAVVPDSPDEDPDLRSHPHTTGPTNGFYVLDILADSSRRAGAVDAVITNNVNAPAAEVDVGIRSFDGMTGGYRAFPLNSVNIPTSTEVPVTLEAGQYISLLDFQIPGNFGSQYGTIRVEIDPADGPLWVALIGPHDDQFGLDDATVVGKTMRGGVVSLDFTYDAPLHGLVLYRDRPSDGSEPRSVVANVWVGPTPANFTPAMAAPGWAAPVVPTYGAPGTSSSTPLPATLIGNTPNTYVNTAIANDGPNPGVPLEQWTRVDGDAGPGSQSSGIVAGGTHTRNFTTPITVPGGRHTLWMNIDPNDLVGESDEGDNLWGRQWVWEPPLLSPGPAASFSAPGDPIGGLDAVLAAQSGVFQFNCVGLRDATPTPSGEDGYWRAIAVMPGATSDVDVRLHDVLPGVTNGFRTVRASSNWGVAQSDYVLTNFRVVSPQPMDAGVVAVSGSEPFLAQTVASKFLATKPSGVYGDFELGTDELLALFEVVLEPGAVAIDLIPTGGSVDFGMTLHRANIGFQSKALTTANPAAWSAPAGQIETLAASVPQYGRYCLAVWKARSTDASVVGGFRLDFHEISATDAPPVADLTRTTLLPLQPNPFNPRTVVAFDLDRDTAVDLRVLDLRGALVRTLVHESMPRGHHETVWNGLDDRGRKVASGVYFVSLQAAGIRDVKKAVLVK